MTEAQDSFQQLTFCLIIFSFSLPYFCLSVSIISAVSRTSFSVVENMLNLYLAYKTVQHQMS